jgi:hypothetical protein
VRQVLALEAGPRPAAPPGGDPANLHDRITEAQREGWLGEIEGLKVSLAGTEDKLAQIDTALHRREQAVHLGMPAFPDIAGRTVPPAPGGTRDRHQPPATS